MPDTGVVDLSELMDEVRKAVQEAGVAGPLLTADPKLVMLKDPAIIGFVMPNDKLAGTKVGNLTNVATQIGNFAGGVGGLVVHEGKIIVGFIPPRGAFGE